MAPKSKYKVSDIQVLKGLEAVRKRPAMYIGSTDVHGLHHIFTEILDNSVDEAIAGYCDNIWVTLNSDGSITIRDNGRGIPVDKHPETKVSTLETVMTNLHAGGKFEKGAYKVSGGLHGIGMKCTNALSEWMRTTVHFDGGIYEQEYERGIPKAPVKKIGDTTKSGTEHTFFPDAQIFKEASFSFNTIVKKCRQHAYLTAGLKITISDESAEEEKKYGLYFEDGIKSYVQFLNLESKVIGNEPFYMNKEEDDIVVEVALQYTDGMEEDVHCYTNNIVNPEGGTHLAGFRTALTTALNGYAQKSELLKGVEGTLNGADVREGLTAIISVKVADPQFEGQTKIKLNNREVKSVVAKVVRDELLTYFEENPQEAKNIIGKAVLANKAKAAAKAARDAVIRKGALESTTLPGKLSDCTSSDPKESELFIVEGDSAGGCFSGDTKVALVDGRSISFYKLIEEQNNGKTNFCYTITKEGKVAISQIQNVRRTKHNTKVVKITLDNEEEIVCTPDHKFMLRNGSYKQAKNLTPNDSLMPLNRKLSEKKGSITIEGYEMVFNGDYARLEDAVRNYNHKIVSIEYLKEKIDVYDLEVPHTHNFALDSGIFVHNSAKQGRDRHTQAILPLRGKIMNTQKYRVDRVLANNEFNDVTTALGVGIGETLDVSKLRYHKIVIMSDADVDGLHITTLVLTLLFRFFKPLIEQGYVYVAQPPLHKVEIGKKKYYFINDEEKNRFVKKAKEEGNVPVENRFKGLGEMNPDQLWETTMNPETRVLKKVEIQDATEAEKTFEMLMGSEVPPRRRFIQMHATKANLDI
jgi:DNA gyrase subunit B